MSEAAEPVTRPSFSSKAAAATLEFTIGCNGVLTAQDYPLFWHSQGLTLKVKNGGASLAPQPTGAAATDGCAAAGCCVPPGAFCRGGFESRADVMAQCHRGCLLCVCITGCIDVYQFMNCSLSADSASSAHDAGACSCHNTLCIVAWIEGNCQPAVNRCIECANKHAIRTRLTAAACEKGVHVALLMCHHSLPCRLPVAQPLSAQHGRLARACQRGSFIPAAATLATA